MAETIDDVTIINRALARIGAGAILSRDEDTDLARQACAIYDDLVDLALAGFHWKWPVQTRRLDRLAATPENGWPYAYGFPPEAIGLPSRLLADPRSPDRPLREFAVEGGRIYCNEPQVWGSFVMRSSPGLWPPLFRAAFTVWLAASLAVPVTHDSNLEQSLSQQAVGNPSENLRGGLMGRAIAFDAAGSNAVAPVLAADPLTDSWHGGV